MKKRWPKYLPLHPGVCCTLLLSLVAMQLVPAGAVHRETSKSTKAAPAKVEEPDPISPATMIGLVRSNHILDPDYPVHITLANSEATLITVRHPKATDQDCKIDAVLVAKTIMDVYPKDVSRVKLILNDSNSANLNEIDVTRGDVKAYATGTISKDELLSSLELKKTEGQALDKHAEPEISTEDSQPVAHGAYMHTRQLLAGRINKLKLNGTGTKPFEEMMAKIEQDVQNTQTPVAPQDLLAEIKELAAHLNEQEQAIRQAKDIAVGKTASYGSRNQAALASGGGNSRRFNGMNGNGGNSRSGGLTLKIMGRIFELQKKGYDARADYAELSHIKELRAQGLHDQARQATESLARKLQIDPSSN